MDFDKTVKYKTKKLIISEKTTLKFEIAESGRSGRETEQFHMLCNLVIGKHLHRLYT